MKEILIFKNTPPRNYQILATLLLSTHSTLKLWFWWRNILISHLPVVYTI